MDYGVDHGNTQIQSDPFSYGGFGYGGFGGGFGFGRGYYYPRFGGFRSAFYYGWDDPFWPGGGITSYIVYKSHLDLDIRRRPTTRAFSRAMPRLAPKATS